MTNRGEMRYFLLLVLCLGIILSKAPAMAETTLTVAMPTQHYEVVRDLWQSQHPEIVLEPYALTGSWAAQLEKALVLAAGGVTFDVFYTATEGFEAAVTHGLLLPLDDFVASDRTYRALLNDIHPRLLSAYTKDGKFYMTPFTWNTQVAMLNLDRFGEAGLSAPKADWSLDDFRRITKKTTIDRSGDGQPDLWGTFIGNSYFANVTWFFMAGNTFLDSELKRPLMDAPSAVEVLQTIFHDLIWVDQVSPLSGGEQDFVKGKFAVYPTYPGVIRSLSRDPQFSYDLMLLPEWKVRETALGTAGYGVTTMSKNREAAFQFVKFMATHEAQGAYMEQVGYPHMASRRASLKSPWGLKIYDTLGYARLIPAPAQFVEIDKALANWVGKVRAGTAAAQEAADQLQAQLKAIL